MRAGRFQVSVSGDATRRMLVVFALVAAMAAGSAFWLGWRAVDDTEARTESGRLGLVELAAAHADHILNEAFFELELLVEFVDLSGAPDHPSTTNFSSPLLWLDGEGRATVLGGSTPESAIDPRVAEVAGTMAHGTDRSISEPFVLPATGHATVALGIPVFSDGGSVESTLVGFVDLDQHLRADLASVAAEFGAPAHVDLVDANGFVLHTAEDGEDDGDQPGDAGESEGHHAEFYRRAVSERRAQVELVLHADGSPPHVVAYAPLQTAPLGVALGAREADAFATSDARRRQLISAAIASGVALVLGMAVVTIDVRRG